jgi:hypothetical protein
MRTIISRGNISMKIVRKSHTLFPENEEPLSIPRTPRGGFTDTLLYLVLREADVFASNYCMSLKFCSGERRPTVSLSFLHLTLQLHLPANCHLEILGKEMKR